MTVLSIDPVVETASLAVFVAGGSATGVEDVGTVAETGGKAELGDDGVELVGAGAPAPEVEAGVGTGEGLGGVTVLGDGGAFAAAEPEPDGSGSISGRKVRSEGT